MMARQKSKRIAFTLIELLVVVAIITILVALLLPSLAAAKQNVQHTTCGTNLRTIGTVTRTFAADHNQRYPMAWGYGGTYVTNDNVTFPTYINYNAADENGMVTTTYNGQTYTVEAWRYYGTPYQTWISYAPSATFDRPAQTWFNWTPSGNFIPMAKWIRDPSVNNRTYDAVSSSPTWGFFINNDYAYFGGLPERKIGNFGYAYVSGYQFGNHAPPVNTTDAGPESVLAADQVRWGGGGLQGSDYSINHPMPSTPNKVGFQNVLYADGHVDGISNPVFRDAATNVLSTTLTTTNWFVVHDAPPSPFAGHYFYVAEH